MDRYNDLNSYLKKRYGVKVYKICIDGGFTCPNRDGTVGFGGCTFCSERGAGENINESYSIEEQAIMACDRSKKKHKAKKFIAYFQNFTGTYGEIEQLRFKYEQSIINKDIVALSIATRPDCINLNIVNLLCEIRSKYNIDIWIELGLQTTNDVVAEKFNRGYKTKVFYNAVELLTQNEIDVVIHILFGLPGENKISMINTIKDVANLKIKGIKFHCLYVVKNTILENLLVDGKYKTLEEDEYIELLVKSISLISPEVVVHRLVSDCRKELLVEPLWINDKNRIRNKILETLSSKNIYQGDKYEAPVKTI